MPKNEAKSKSVRKPLRDVSNKNKNGGRFSKPLDSKKRFSEKEKEQVGDRCCNVEEDDSLDTLLLVQSDLSSLIHQIDELVVQTFKLKSTGKEGRKEIESFTHFLSEMLSSLKPWFPRFQKALSSPSAESENQLGQTGESKIVSLTNEVDSDAVDSPEQTMLDSLISPSPLVSWRADCTIERSRQLFLLTPLPISKSLLSKRQDPSKAIFERITSNTTAGLPSFCTISEDLNDDLLESVPIRPTPSKPSDSAAIEMGKTLQSEFAPSSVLPKKECSMLVMTPCSKMSPPKSCVVLEPISEYSHQGNYRFRKATPFPCGINCSSSQLSESSDSDTSGGLAFKYPELLGIQQAYKPGIGKKKVEASPGWFVSPPKTCVLLKPPDEKSLNNAADGCQMPLSRVYNQQINLSFAKEDNFQCGVQQTSKSCNQEPLGGNLACRDSTPMWKEPESTIHIGKRPGENTLKKELWTRFEEASTHGLRFNASGLQNTTQKGFLDLLDEASCDEES
ncbi:UDP-N-acetylglucosamine pyrophosphorylase [Fagus crenata]